MSSNNIDSTLSLEVVSDFLSDVVSEENIIDAVFDTSSGKLKGDGYTSYLTKVLIKGKNKELEIIIKCAPKNPVTRDALPTRLIFLREMKYYQAILPAFKKLQIERNVKKLFNSAPVCYKTCDLDLEEKIALEDLRASNFKLFPKARQMNDNHINMVLDVYAQLHAVSFTMKEYDPKCFEKLGEGMEYLITFKHMKIAMEIITDGAEKIQNLFDEEKESDVFNYFKNVKDNVVPFFDLLENYSGKGGVFIHGDSWCNNMMFKYENDELTSPTEMRLLDFQIGSLMPPAIDVIYFFYVSASPEMMDNYEYYQKLYHNHLSKYMEEMGCDVEKYYPFSVFQEDWKKYAQLGLYLSTCIYRLRFQGDDEIIDFSEASPKDAIMKSSKFDDFINQKYRDIALHFYKYKLL